MKANTYFPGLNAIRVYAAVSVIIEHAAGSFAHLRPYSTNSSLIELPFLSGYQAVSLFFVLSGFLITYLLLQERSKTGGISTKRFYLRRALRILPLYYLIAVIGVFGLPLLLGAAYPITPTATVGVLLMLPVFAGAIVPLGALGHLWSISVEEYFYAVWSWVNVSTRRMIVVSVIIVGGRLALDAIVPLFDDTSLSYLQVSLRFECMVVGACGAYLYVFCPALCRVLYRRSIQITTLLLFALIVLLPAPQTVIINIVVSVVFLLVILNVATNPRVLVNIERAALRYWGERSYGLYMYHVPILYLLMVVLQNTGAWYDPLLYALTLGLTFTVAPISYRFIERPILRLKDRIGYRREVTPATAS